MFDIYNGQASHKGNLLLKPTGLTGNGIMKLDLAEVSSKFFSFNSTWFKADTANLNVCDNSSNLAFSAKNARAKETLKIEKECFSQMEQVHTLIFLLVNTFAIDQLNETDNEQLIGNNDPLSTSDLNLFLNIDQDSLSFMQKVPDIV